MIIYILDRTMTIIGSASTELPDSWHLTSDDRVDELSAGVATFNFTVSYEPSKRIEAQDLFQAGYYILRQNKDLDQYEWYTIIDSEADAIDGTTECYCEDAGLDLLNEVVPAFSGKSNQQGVPDKSYTCRQLIGDTMSNSWNRTSGIWDTGFEIGVFQVNESAKVVPDYSEETASARILNIANDFNADIYYTFSVSGNRITHKYLNITTYRGSDNPTVLRLNHEVKDIKTKVSVADLVTAVTVTGGTVSVKTKNGEQQQTVTLNGMKYDDGDIWLSGSILSSRSATTKYSRYLAASEPKKIDGHIGRIIGAINSSLTDKQQLLNYAVSELKRRMHPTTSYTIDLYDNTDMSLYKVGDTIKIVDDEDKTYLSARIQKTEISYSDRIVKIELGDFKQLDSGISSQLEQLATKVGQQLSTMPVYTWIAYADDASGTNLSKTPQKSEQEYFQYIGISPNHVDIDYDASTVDPADFTWTKVKGDQGVPGVGEDGKTYYIHIAYADSDTGLQNFSVDNATGRSYMGVFNDLIQADPTPTDADLTRFSKYKWSLIKGRSAYIHIKYSTSDNGANMQDAPIPGEINYIGIANTSGPTDPATPAEYKWSQFTGDVGPQGASVKGDDGKTYYIHIAYANSEDGKTDYSVQDPTGRTYMGCFTDLVQDDPTSTSDERFKLYKWSKIQADQMYIHLAYSTSADGKDNFSKEPFNGCIYQGTYTDTSKEGSEKYSDYTWFRTMGEPGIQGAQGPQGVQGPPGDDGKTSYVHIKYAPVIKPADSQLTENPDAYIGICTDFSSSDPTTASSYTWSKFEGNDGPQGIQGPPGDDGKTTYVHFAYATSADGKTGFSTSPFNGAVYLGTYTDFKSSDSNTYTDYHWARIKGEQGIKGDPGNDGTGINSVTVSYGVSTSNTTKPTTWSNDLPTSVAEGSYVWTRTITDYTDDSIADTVTYTYARQGKNGQNGQDGHSPTVTATKSGSTTTISVDGKAQATVKDGSNGTSVKVSSVQYQAGSSNTTAPTGTWSSSVVAVSEGQYLWTKTTFSDNSVAYGVAKQGKSGQNGADGNSVTSVTIEYYKSTSASELAGGSWSSTAPAWENGKYIWQRTKTVCSKTGTSYSTPVNVTGQQGKTGGTGGTGATGQGVSSITPQYYLSSSNSSQTGGSWSNSMPAYKSGYYYWTRSQVNWINPTNTTYTTAVLANGLNDANSNAASANAAASAASSTANAAKSAVDNMQIGGRNLIRGSGNMTLDYEWTGDKGEGPYGNKDTWTTSPWTGPYIKFKDIVNRVGLKVGDKLTCSIWVKSEGDYNNASFTMYRMFPVATTDWVYPRMNVNLKKDEWTKISITETIYSIDPSRLTNTARFECDGLVRKNSEGKNEYYLPYNVHFSSPKLELGDKSTDWTPAPEDVDAKVDKTVKSVKTQYYISTSNTTQSGGAWKYVVDILANDDESSASTSPNKYLWSRIEMTLADGSVTYSDPVLQNDINDLYEKHLENYHMITQNDESYISQFRSIATVTDKLAEDISDNSTAIDNINDKTNQNTTDISTLKQTSNSISATVQQMQDSVDSLRSANAKLTYEGLTVQTQDENKDGKSQSLINSDGLTVRGYDVNTGKYDKTIARFTQNESILNSATVQDHMDIGGIRIREYEDYEYDGKTKHEGAGFFWTGKL